MTRGHPLTPKETPSVPWSFPGAQHLLLTGRLGLSPQHQPLGMTSQLGALAFLCLPALGTADTSELYCLPVEFGYFI